MKYKIRHKNWYWGKWVYEGEHGFSIKDPDFELYDEETHGWTNSDEFKSIERKLNAKARD